MHKKDTWYTFSNASEKIGKNRNYFSNRFRLSPELFETKGFKIVAGIKLINDEGISHVLNRIKKVAAHVNKCGIYVVSALRVSLRHTAILTITFDFKN